MRERPPPARPRLIVSNSQIYPQIDKLTALQKLKVRHNPTMGLMLRQDWRRELIAEAERILDYNDLIDRRPYNAIATLRAAVGLMTHARLYVDTPGWDQAEAARLVAYAVKFVGSLLALSRRDFKRARLTDDQAEQVEALFEFNKLLQEDYAWRRGEGSESLVPISRAIQARGGRSGASDHLHALRLLKLPQSGGLVRLSQKVRQDREALTAVNLSVANARDPLFMDLRDDPSMQADHDLNTTIARLCGLEAALLLADGLAFKRTLMDRTRRQVDDLLHLAHKAFDASRERWWHGIANFLLVEAVFGYAQGDRDTFYDKLAKAMKIYNETNDHWRMSAVLKITAELGDHSFVLEPAELDILLFRERW
jgi:hypothetical protein